MYKCEECKLDFINKGSCVRHNNRCRLKECDINKIKNEYVYEFKSTKILQTKYNISFTLLKKILGNKIRNSSEAIKLYKEKNPDKIKHSDDTKKKLSEIRKKYLKQNPDKHPWKNNEKFISKPCEKFKEILNAGGIKYLSEYTPLENYNYSIDIAFPNIKLGIEINGNQHYNNDKTLKDYYQNRHDILVKNGWDILEIHYSCVYIKNKMDELLSLIEKRL